MNDVLKGVSMVLIALALLALGGSLRGDDTDPPDGRSGMRLLTDAHTGCQYLAVPLGGITPRLDGEGRQVGCKS